MEDNESGWCSFSIWGNKKAFVKTLAAEKNTLFVTNGIWVIKMLFVDAIPN